MVTLLFLYKRTKDEQSFNEHYQASHALLKEMPNLRSLTVNAGKIQDPDGESPFQAVAALQFDSFAELQAAIPTSQAAAIRADIESFPDGVHALIYETREI